MSDFPTHHCHDEKSIRIAILSDEFEVTADRWKWYENEIRKILSRHTVSMTYSMLSTRIERFFGYQSLFLGLPITAVLPEQDDIPETDEKMGLLFKTLVDSCDFVVTSVGPEEINKNELAQYMIRQADLILTIWPGALSSLPQWAGPLLKAELKMKPSVVHIDASTLSIKDFPPGSFLAVH